MAQYEVETDVTRVSGWAIGGLTFAGSMMVLGARSRLSPAWQRSSTISSLSSRGYTFNIDVTAWGWIHLILGIFLLTTGFALFAGRVWAGVTAIVLAMLSAVSNFFFIPYYPWWAALVIALDVWAIWALTRPGALQTRT
jgi:hypothetical protein